MQKFTPLKFTDRTSGSELSCYLVKYEKKIYKTARIGTLEYYRNLEGNQGDSDEGTIEGVIYTAEKDRGVSREDILSLSGGSLDIRATGGIKLGKGAKYTDEKPRRCCNAYIYCCSIEPGVFPEPNRMAYFKATEFFVIDKTKEFRRLVGEELFKKAKTKEGFPYSKDKHYIKSWEAPVQYRARNKAIVELPFNIFDVFIYRKDPIFQIENEFRFTWIFFDKKTNLPVEMAIDPVDIDCNHSLGEAHIK